MISINLQQTCDYIQFQNVKKNCFREAKRVYTKDTRKLENINRNISNSNNTCTKNIISGMRLNRLTSYIKN